MPETFITRSAGDSTHLNNINLARQYLEKIRAGNLSWEPQLTSLLAQGKVSLEEVEKGLTMEALEALIAQAEENDRLVTKARRWSNLRAACQGIQGLPEADRPHEEAMKAIEVILFYLNRPERKPLTG